MRFQESFTCVCQEEGNRAAHLLARHQLCFEGDDVIEEISDFLQSVVNHRYC